MNEVIQDTTSVVDNFQGDEMMSLMFKVIIILFFGIVVWRIMTAVQSRSAQPKKSSYFKKRYSDKWKNR